jgi:hypothetical protein
MRMPPLAAGNIEDARAGRRAEDVDQAGDLVAVALEREQRLVLEQVLGVEVCRPPVGRLGGRLVDFTWSRGVARRFGFG